MRRTDCGPLTRLRRVVGITCAGVALVLTGCSDEMAAPRPLDVSDLRTAVTQSVASEVGSDGRFVFPATPPHEVYPQVSPGEAQAIALAWARTFGKYVRGEMERIHGKPIDFDALRVASPAYYAAAVYEPVSSDLAPGYRFAFGPQYMVYLGNDEGPVFSIAVAAFAPSAVVNGRLELPAFGGMEIVPSAIPRGEGYFMPVSPEQAASIASRASGALVSALPELVTPGRGYHPQFSRWKVALDRPVRVRSVPTGSERTVRELYVGLRGEIATPAAVQPHSTEIFDRNRQQMAKIPRRAARATAFERVSFPAPR